MTVNDIMPPMHTAKKHKVVIGKKAALHIGFL